MDWLVPLCGVCTNDRRLFVNMYYLAGAAQEELPGGSREPESGASGSASPLEDEADGEEEDGLLSPAGSVTSLRRQARSEGFATTGEVRWPERYGVPVRTVPYRIVPYSTVPCRTE